jgi:tripartite ATP-independent transporter DctM subunit
MILCKAAERLERILTVLTRVANGVGSSILLGMVLLMAVNVALRYLLRQPLKGTVELEEFMLVTVVFLGLAYTAVKKGHVRVDFLVSRFPKPIQALINAITVLMSIGLCALVVWRSITYGLESWIHQKQSVLLHIPVAVFVWLVSAGALLLLLVLLAECLHALSELMERGGSWVLGLIGGGIVTLGLGFLVWALNPSPSAAALIGFVVLLLMLAARMYIAFSMMLVGFLGMSYISGSEAGFYLMGTVPYNTTAAYGLCVIPFFVLMGHLCAVAGISTDLYNTAYKWLGSLRGGLAMGTMAGCAGFAAVSGDSMGTAAVMGAAALPEMKRFNYADSLATGCVAAGGTLGILIPPSMGFIIYAIITDQSISKLFIAGIFPGLLLTLLFMAVIYVQSLLDPSKAPPGPKLNFKEKLMSLKSTWAMILIFFLVIGGIYWGVFTPTEAGAIGATGALLIGLAKRQLSWQKLITALLDTGRTVSMLFLLLIGAQMLGAFLAGSEAPNQISAYISQLPLTRYLLLAAILFLYLLLGCIMNILPAVIVTLPIFFPTIIDLRFDPIWFGVIMVIVMEMGLITPPVGMNVFVIKGVAKDVSIDVIYRGILPFLVAMVVSVLILTAFPGIALYLPNATR